jgi:hypothetical protein
MQIVYEPQRLYVAPRKSVLFFARIDGEKIRCYVDEVALVEPARGLREDADVFQRCLLAFDQHRAAIESAASRLLMAGQLDEDGAVTISSAALALEVDPPLAALAGRTTANKAAEKKRSTPGRLGPVPDRRRIRRA